MVDDGRWLQGMGRASKMERDKMVGVPECICEWDVDLEEDQEEDGDDGDIFNNWDITIEDVERIKQFLTPNIPDVIDDVIQPLIPKTVHTIPPDKDYVTPATKSILDDILEEFGVEILNVTMVDEGAECNPTKDLEELERLLAKDPQSHYMEIGVHSVIIKLEPFIHTQLMSLLYGVFKISKSSTKPYKVDRDITSPKWFSLQGDGIRGLLDSFYVLYRLMVDVARGSKLGEWLRECCLFIIQSKSRGVFHFNSTLILEFFIS
ncbi:hypothetical protein Tco_0853018 [Tanacetum coccineum]